ncbi:MAG: DUF262 domain-containing protein [Actinobacteria bacterium]|nr:DUF262 domain-containing protein [Actinomycetota bacterium]
MVEQDDAEGPDEAIDDAVDGEELPFRYAISSYGADYPVDGLVKRLTEGAIYVPDFQRAYVWSLRDASRLVESLLLGLPVPGVFLSKEEQTNKLLVIDGQQRLRSLQFFYSGVFEPTKRELALEGVQPQFEGKTYRTLDAEDRRHLDDAIIHATVMRQDVPTGDDSSIYHVFERLNTGGKVLSPQEIRACLYHGPFEDLLSTLNEDLKWREIFGRKNKRLRDQELILRYLALFFDLENYRKPLKGFLNAYMKKNRFLNWQGDQEVHRAFLTPIHTIHRVLGRHAFRPERNLNAAVFDAVMVGLGRALDDGALSDDRVEKGYRSLLANPDFIEATSTGTSDEDVVQRRVALAGKAFTVDATA